MAPTKKDAKSEADQHTIADGEQNAGTQDTEVIDIYSLAVKSMKELEIRRENRRQKLRLDYIIIMSALEKDITTALQDDFKRISKAYKAKTRKLSMVLKKRKLIEKNIADSLERLEIAYNQAANELQLTAAGRIGAAAKQDDVADKTESR